MAKLSVQEIRAGLNTLLAHRGGPAPDLSGIDTLQDAVAFALVSGCAVAEIAFVFERSKAHVKVLQSKLRKSLGGASAVTAAKQPRAKQAHGGQPPAGKAEKPVPEWARGADGKFDIHKSYAYLVEIGVIEEKPKAPGDW